ncbi:MAG: helix-turn-helix domain-containing protein [Rhizobacter sp.]|nr:helix-turn-helix domain-containing protein [Rhizobacter sp.]
MSSSAELGDFLRSRRTRLRPGKAGAAGGWRRRTPGLRREEVAERAGISTDWYVRMEQGRSVSPSAATIEALARALELDAQEHAHLRTLAGHLPARRFVRETVPPTVRRIVEGLQQPAYVTGQRWDLLAWNAPACALFCDFAALPRAERNLLHFMFADGRAKALFGEGWATAARAMLAQFRATHDLWAGDPGFAELVDRLRAASPGFAAWWQDHDIRAPMSGRKTLHHPTRGLLRFDHASFQANDNPALKLVMYTPAA